MGKLYKILPVFEERLWGGQRLRERFGYRSGLKNIAEVYNVIAIPGHLDLTLITYREPEYTGSQELNKCTAGR